MRALVALLGFVIASVCGAQAQDAVADFYRGKQIQLRIGFPPGSGYDLAGRLVAPHLGKYIPGNPGIVVQNVEGAGSLTLTNQLYNTAARDGTVIGLISNAAPTTPFLSPETAHFDVSKFNWIGSNAPEVDVVLVTGASPIRTIEDLFSKETIVGASGVGGALYDMPIVMNALMGTKFKLISGYSGSGQVTLAMTRGELHGQGGMGWTSIKSHNLADVKRGDLRVIAQYGLKKHPDLPDVPLFDLPKDETDKQALLLRYARMSYGRPLLMPPGVPAERVKAIRTAFLAAMKDPGLLADADRAGMDIEPVSGEELTELTAEVMKTTPAAAARLRQILSPAEQRK